MEKRGIRKIWVCLLVGMFGLLVFGPTPADAATINQVIEFGKEGKVGADISVASGIVSANAGFDFSAGIDWPVEVRMTHPDTIAPGDNMQISIDTVGKSGAVWYKFNGYADCRISYGIGTAVLAEKTINIPRTNLISLTVPIGENITQNASSSEITVWTGRKDIDLALKDYYVEADIRFKFDFEVTTTSYVSGNVICDGNATESSINENHKWGGPYSKTIPISSTALPGNSVDVSVSNMKYVLEKIIVKIKTFYVYVGYESDWSVIGSDPNAISTTISINKFIPESTTRADNRANGEFINTFDEVPVIADFNANIAIPFPEDINAGSDSDNELSTKDLPSWLLPLSILLNVIFGSTIILLRKKPNNKDNLAEIEEPGSPASAEPPPASEETKDIEILEKKTHIIQNSEWVPLAGRQRQVAEQELIIYKRKLKKAFNSGKLTKEDCQSKAKQREIELGLRPPIEV